MTADRRRPWPPSYVDSLGRGWLLTKLDSLLTDAQVAETVRRFRADVDGPGITFSPPRARAWARQQGRSEAGLALLLLLRWHVIQAERRSA